MRKIYSILLLLCTVLAASAETKTIRQDFNDCSWSSNYDKVTNDNLPTGWYVLDGNNGSTNLGLGVGGSKCVKGPANVDNTITLITKAYGSADGATVSFMLKRVAGFAPGSCALYKMVEDGNGSFTYGDKLHDIDVSGCTNSDFTKVSYNGLTEDCWLGIKFTQMFFDDYENTYASVEGVAKYTVSGTVKCDETPVAGASVSLFGKSGYTTTTGDDGSFIMTDVDVNEYKLVVTADGYKKYEQDLTVSDADVTVPVEITVTESVLVARVMSWKTSKPIDNATVSLYDGETLATTGTSINGLCTLKVYGKVAQIYTVKASAPHYEDYNGMMENAFKEGETKFGYSIYMEDKEMRFIATVTNSKNEPISNAVVTVTRNADGTSKDAVNQYSGDYLYTIAEADLAEGETFTVSVKADGYSAAEDYTFAFESQHANKTFVLLQPATVSGVVSGADGMLVAGAALTLTDNTGAEVATATSGEDGSYSITVEGTPAESYTLTAKAKYYKNFSQKNLVLEAGKNVEQNITMKVKTLDLTVMVMGEDYQPVEGATVTLTYGDETVNVEWDSEGFVYYIEMAERDYDGKDYTLTVSKEGYVTYTQPYNFATDATGFVTVAFEKQKTVISGVVSGADGMLVAGAALTLTDNTGAEVATATSGEDGAYSITVEGTPAESYTLTATAKYYRKFTQKNLVLEAGTDVEQNITMKVKTLDLTVMVFDENYASIEGATVTLTYGDETVNVEWDSERDAYYIDMAERDYEGKDFTLTVSKEGYITYTQLFNFATDATGIVKVLFEKDPATAIAGAKSGAKGVTIADGKLYISGNAAIYDLGGRLVKTVKAADSKVMVDLPAGCYIINGKKVNVR